MSLSIESPFHVSHAFIAAEDRRFFDHYGIDWQGIARAAYKNAMAFKFQQGASTITQQVARHVLLTNDKRISRKIKEMLLARKIEQLWGKQNILYVYLNEIYLGDQCYGIEAAARNYFGKHVTELSIAEAALLAGIVPSPSKYNPVKNRHMSMVKQRLVLGNMLTSGVITKEEYEKALKEKLKFRTKADRPFDIVPDFTEAVRRYVTKKYGESRVYQEGLKVYTTCRLEDQKRAIQALKKGLDELKDREKRHTVLRKIKEEDLAGFLGRRSTPKLVAGHNYQGLVTGVSQSPKGTTRLHVSLDKLVHGHLDLPKRSSAYKVGHLLSLTFEKYENSLPVFVQAEDPPLQGALACVENGTGFVRALVGGSSRDHFQFNRATQAKRQPGSVFKPIIYAAALEQFGYTPATIIIDEPVVIELKGREEDWAPNNADLCFLGPISLRRALEKSRNICTIKILMDIGFDPVIQLARRMGIRSKLEKNLSLCLGTSETSLVELTSAYTVFPNGGVYLEPVLVKKIEDRYGNLLEDNTRITRLDKGFVPVPSLREKSGQIVVAPCSLITLGKARPLQVECPSPEDPMRGWPSDQNSFGRSAHDQRRHQLPNTAPVPNACPPRPRLERPALSPQTAFIMTSLLQGVVRTGTGSRLAKYTKRRDLCGKTGTTDNSDDAWFIGYNPNYTTGVWVGFDDNRPLGREETGAQAALPIWGYFMNGLLEGSPQKKYPVPEKLVRRSMPTVVVDKGTGTVIGTAMEPVYAPLSGKTLAVSPLDSLEAIQLALAEAEQVREQRAMAGRPYEATYVPNQHGPIPVMAGGAARAPTYSGLNSVQ